MTERFEKIKSRIIKYDLTGIAKRVFGADKSVHDYYNDAAAQVKSGQKKRQDNLSKVLESASLRLLGRLSQRVFEHAPAIKKSGMDDIKEMAANGKSPKAIWDRIVKGHMKQAVYLYSSSLPDQENYMGVDHSRKMASAVIAHMKKDSPAFYEALKALFDFCEENDMAVTFDYPARQKDVPYGLRSVLKVPEDHMLPLWKMVITVSPLDPHYKPLTVLPGIPEDFDGSDHTLRSRGDCYTWFTMAMRSALNPHSTIKRLVTGRTYSV